MDAIPTRTRTALVGSLALAGVTACGDLWGAPASGARARAAEADTDVPPIGVMDSGGTSPDCDVEHVGDRVRFLPQWPQLNGCEDAIAYLSPRDQDLLITARLQRPPGPPTVGTVGTFPVTSLPPGFDLTMVEGRNLFAGTCLGWFYPGIEALPGPRWQPVEGTLTFVITEVPPDAPYVATLSFEGVTFARADDDAVRCTLPDMPPRSFVFYPATNEPAP